MKILGIIPARYASTRFPAKALADIGGKTMIKRVYEQCLKSSLLQELVIATDHELIFNHVKEWGGKVVMTSETHPSGTDRCFEAYKKLNKSFDFVINIQGDEPFIQPEQIDKLASVLTSEVEIATLIKEIDSLETLLSPNIVKAIFNKKREAIYFSRHPIPFVRGKAEAEWLKLNKFYKHLGIYAYRTDILEKITALQPSTLEMAESLEQLRWLENGYKILASVTELETIGIDSPEDLKKIQHLI